MLLAIDVGNTQTVLGVYEGETLLYMWRVATNKTATSDELRVQTIPLLEADNVSLESIGGSVLASVVPALTEQWGVALFRMFGAKPIVCNAETAGDLFEADYSNPREIGSDRVADAVAARFLYGAPVVTVDFGTATNVEIIDKDGRFIGGIIAPGLQTSAAALFSHATKLPAIDLVDPHSAIGKNTTHAMQSGIVYGEADRVDGLVRRVFAELGYETPVIATGGLALRMAPLCKTVTHTNPELTLEGLRLVYENVKK